MAEYIYPKQSSVLGWSVTFNPTDKMPVIGSRIWTTLADLQAYLNDATSSAIAGIQVAVVADPVSDNNGTYEIVFDSLERLVSGANYVGIKGGKATGTYATLADAQAAVSGGTIDSYNPNIAFTYDDNGVTKSNLTYRKLLGAGDVGNDTYVTRGELRVDTSVTPNVTYLDLFYNTTPQGASAPVSIDVTDLVPPAYADSVVTYNATAGTLNATQGLFNDTAVNVIKDYVDAQIPQQPTDSVVTYNTVAGTLNATQGLFNDTAVNVIKDYVDDFDCGSFTI